MVEQEGTPQEKIEPEIEFSKRSALVILSALKEAQDLHHNYIGDAHILLGLGHESEGPVKQVFDRLGVDLERMRQQVNFIIVPDAKSTQDSMQFTPRAKRVLELAAEASEENKDIDPKKVDPIHILTGIVRLDQGIASDLLRIYGLNKQTLNQFIQPR